MQQLKKAPAAVEVEKRKIHKKNFSYTKKNSCKENRGPTEKRKMSRNEDSFTRYQTRDKQIYDRLYALKLTERELEKNEFPSVNGRSKYVVPKDSLSRQCVRCSQSFEIYGNLHFSLTNCFYHPSKAVFDPRTHVKKYVCCDKPTGHPGCAESKYHVTMQHGPKRFIKTAPRDFVIGDYGREIFALDCEMSYTTAGLEVTRIGLLDYHHRYVINTYVRPTNPILDYNTKYSGVQKKHLDGVTTTPEDMQKLLSKMIYEDTILVGHGLNNDLEALGLIHNTVVDTSVLYAYGGKKPSLKSLAADFLNKRIQYGSSGHDCIDDATASLQLAVLKIK